MCLNEAKLIQVENSWISDQKSSLDIIFDWKLNKTSQFIRVKMNEKLKINSGVLEIDVHFDVQVNLKTYL